MNRVASVLKWPPGSGLCLLCCSGSIEDAEHFLLHCRGLVEHRLRFRAMLGSVLAQAGVAGQALLDHYDASTVSKPMAARALLAGEPVNVACLQMLMLRNMLSSVVKPPGFSTKSRRIFSCSAGRPEKLVLARYVWNPVFCAGPRLCQFLPGSVCPPSGQHALSGVTPANRGYLGYQSRPLLHLSVLVAVRISLSCGAAAPLECFTGGVTPMPVSLV